MRVSQGKCIRCFQVCMGVVLISLGTSIVRAEAIVLFDFNDASDPTAVVDLSGKGNHGEVHGEDELGEDAIYTAAGEGRTGGGTDRAMDFGDFDNGAFVSIPSAEDGAFDSLLDNDQVTLTMWTFGGEEQPVDQWTFYAGPFRQLGSHIPWSNSNVYFDVAGTSDDACCNDRINTAIDFDTFADEWNHYAFVKLEDETQIYQNGEFLLDGFDMRPLNEITEFFIGVGPEGDRRSYNGLIDDFGVFDTALTQEEIIEIMENGFAAGGPPALQAGDANQDLKFDQIDLVQVQVAAKYLTAQPATWGEGDWDGAPSGEVGSPPAGDGVFSQLDIIAALNAGTYLQGPYAAVVPEGSGDGNATLVYDPGSGELSVRAGATELTSINIDSAAAVFTGDAAMNLGGSFDNDADNNIFKATFGSSFGSLTFGNVAQTGLAEDFLLNDLTVIGSLAGGGDLGNVDLIYVPEPASLFLALTGLIGFTVLYRRSR